MFVRASLGSGHSVRWALEAFLRVEESSDVRTLRLWFLDREQNRERSSFATEKLSIHARALFALLDKGLRGEAIAPLLTDMEKEFLEVCEEDIECFASRLPLYLMGILAGFAFPAMMFALVGPVALELLRF